MLLVFDLEATADFDIVAVALHAVAAEAERRVLFGVEKIRRLQVTVALLLVRIDARRLDALRNLGRRQIRRVELDVRIQARELSTNRPAHHELDCKPYYAVLLIIFSLQRPTAACGYVCV